MIVAVTLIRDGSTLAKFLNTTATSYHLEELIKSAKDRLILISPFLKINERIREMLEDKNRLKIDTRVIYGKNELHPDESSWLNELSYVRTSFCKNLHAKCYLNEEQCIITSLNLYEFSQVNNHEMGILLSRTSDADLYRDAAEEAQRIIRSSEEVRISVEKVAREEETTPDDPKPASQSGGYSKLTIAKLAAKQGIKTQEMTTKLIAAGLLETRNGNDYLTDKGKSAGGEFRKGSYGIYFIWPENLTV